MIFARMEQETRSPEERSNASHSHTATLVTPEESLVAADETGDTESVRYAQILCFHAKFVLRELRPKFGCSSYEVEGKFL